MHLSLDGKRRKERGSTASPADSSERVDEPEWATAIRRVLAKYDKAEVIHEKTEEEAEQEQERIVQDKIVQWKKDYYKVRRAVSSSLLARLHRVELVADVPLHLLVAVRRRSSSSRPRTPRPSRRSPTATSRACSGSCTTTTPASPRGAGSTTTTTRPRCRVRPLSLLVVFLFSSPSLARLADGALLPSRRPQGRREDDVRLRPRQALQAVRAAHGCPPRPVVPAHPARVPRPHERPGVAHHRLLPGHLRAGHERQEAGVGGDRQDPLHRREAPPQDDGGARASPHQGGARSQRLRREHQVLVRRGRQPDLPVVAPRLLPRPREQPHAPRGLPPPDARRRQEARRGSPSRRARRQAGRLRLPLAPHDPAHGVARLPRRERVPDRLAPRDHGRLDRQPVRRCQGRGRRAPARRRDGARRLPVPARGARRGHLGRAVPVRQGPERRRQGDAAHAERDLPVEARRRPHRARLLEEQGLPRRPHRGRRARQGPQGCVLLSPLPPPPRSCHARGRR